MEQLAPEGLSPVGGTHAGAGEECDEEQTAEIRRCTEHLPGQPHSPSHCASGGEEEGKSAVNLSL